MLPDFALIQKNYGPIDQLNIYPIGDVHIGSANFDLSLFKKWVQTVQEDPHSAVIIVGDMMDMGLKNSKTNIYEAVLTPRQQKELCYELLLPIVDKILAGCSGNHENRAVREVGSNPLYDVFCRLGIEDRYRENACFIKIQVGHKKRNPIVYGVVATHGKSKSKDEKWNYTVDGCDCFISGHTHKGTHAPGGKIKMDFLHNTVKTTGYQHVVVLPFLKYGGYALAGKYTPNHPGQFQTITFSGIDRRVGYIYK